MGRRNKVKPEIKNVGRAYVDVQEIARLKNEYITNLINGRFFTARCNMMVEQLSDNKITEVIDSRIKSKEYLAAEYYFTRKQAIVCFRQAHFSRKDLIDKYKFTQEDITTLEERYYTGKIILENYDESYKKHNKAEFVQHTKKTKS